MESIKKNILVKGERGMSEEWNKAVEEGKVHICTCLDMCGWQPCPYDMEGKPRPEGCPYDDKIKIEKNIKGKTFVSIASIKRATGLSGHTIGVYLKDSGEWERWSAGKTSRAVWKRRESNVRNNL